MVLPRHRRPGKFSAYYKSEQEIKDLKFNTGDWKYQCFDTLYVFTEEELENIFEELPEDDYKSWKEFANKTKWFGVRRVPFVARRLI